MAANGTHRTRLIAAILGVVAVALIAFVVIRLGGNTTDKPPQSVRYRLKWLANTGFVGDLYADTYGLFIPHKLDVKVLAGGPEHNAIRQIETGEAEFGVASADQVILALEKGSRIVVVAQLYRQNPVRWIYYERPGRPVVQAQDLRGLRIGVAPGDNDDTIMRALLAKHALKADGQAPDVVLTPIRYDYAPFTTGLVDLFPVYINTQGVDLMMQARAAGKKVEFFDPQSSGIRFVANSIVTSDRLAQDNPALVQSFVSAVLDGWQQALAEENEERTIKSLESWTQASEGQTSEQFRETLREQLAETRKLLAPTAACELGAIDIAEWKETERIMLGQGVIKAPVGVETYLKPQFAGQCAR